MEAGETYPFLKKDQRNYWLEGEVPLLETQGGGVLSRPKASILILKATHTMINEEVYTKGKYKVTEVFKDEEMHFDGFNKID